MTTTALEKLKHIEKNTLGMALFLINEAVFFALLIIAFVNFRNSVKSGPNAAAALEPLTTALFTVALLSSSFTIRQADKNLERKNHARMLAWLVATIALGGIFLVGQGMEYRRLLTNDVTISRNIFGSTFFTLTGFHGLHVLVGLIMLATLAAFAFSGGLKGPKSSGMAAISLYWHFVDVVWVVIFGIIYVWTAGLIKF